MILPILKLFKQRLNTIKTLKEIDLYNQNLLQNGNLTQTPCSFIEFPPIPLETVGQGNQTAEIEVVFWVVSQSLRKKNGIVVENGHQQHEVLDTAVFDVLQGYSTVNFTGLQRTGYELDVSNHSYLISKQRYCMAIYIDNPKQATIINKLKLDIK